MTEEKKTVDLGLLDEDDAFEEFPTEGKSAQLSETFLFKFKVNNAGSFDKQGDIFQVSSDN